MLTFILNRVALHIDVEDIIYNSVSVLVQLVPYLLCS